VGNPFPVPIHSYSVHMFYLVYISVILLALSKRARIKISENKSEKITTPCRTPIAVDPAKRDVERTNSELFSDIFMRALFERAQ